MTQAKKPTAAQKAAAEIESLKSQLAKSESDLAEANAQFAANMERANVVLEETLADCKLLRELLDAAHAEIETLKNQAVQSATNSSDSNDLSTDGYIANTPVRHNGKLYQTGEKIPDLGDGDATRLVAQGYVSVSTGEEK